MNVMNLLADLDTDLIALFDMIFGSILSATLIVVSIITFAKSQKIQKSLAKTDNLVALSPYKLKVVEAIEKFDSAIYTLLTKTLLNGEMDKTVLPDMDTLIRKLDDNVTDLYDACELIKMIGGESDYKKTLDYFEELYDESERLMVELKACRSIFENEIKIGHKNRTQNETLKNVERFIAGCITDEENFELYVSGMSSNMIFLLKKYGKVCELLEQKNLLAFVTSLSQN